MRPSSMRSAVSIWPTWSCSSRDSFFRSSSCVATSCCDSCAHLLLGFLRATALLVSERRSSTRSRMTAVQRDDEAEEQAAPEQPVQIAAERRLTARHLGALRREVGVVELLDLLRDRQHRLAPRQHFAAQEAGALADLLDDRPVEQRLERLPVVVELRLEARQCRSSSSGRPLGERAQLVDASRRCSGGTRRAAARYSGACSRSVSSR